MGTNIDASDKYKVLLLKIVAYGGILLPLLVIIYGLAAEFELVPRSELYSTPVSIFIGIAFAAVSIYQFLSPAVSQRRLAVYMIAYHILGAAFLLFISGVTTSVSMCWIVLLILTQLYFNRVYFIYSLLGFWIVALLSFSLESNYSLPIFYEYVGYTLFVGGVALFVAILRSVQDIAHDDFIRTQRRGELRREQLHALINSLNEAMVQIDSQGKIRIYNAAALSLFDTNQSLSGLEIDHVLHGYDQDDKPIKIHKMLQESGRAVSSEKYSHQYSDGEKIRLSISAAPIRARSHGRERINGHILLLRDITKSKSLEEERDEFISVISHELRTPITITEGTLSNLQLLFERGAFDVTTAKSALKDAHEQIIYLANMVNDLGTLSRAERGVGDAPEEIDVKSLLTELYDRYATKATDKGLTLNIDINTKLGTVHTSRLYLEEMLQNFLTNAIKYTHKGSITLSAKHQKGGTYFAVTDTGIGISKSDQKHVYQKFYRSEDYRTRETSGTGLGLYVVQKLAHKLDVDIDLQSRLNHGSTFGFLLKGTVDET